MGAEWIVLIVLGVVVVAVVIWVIAKYNGLVELKNRFENAFAQIDVQLKRRYDLIPNLVETAKGYMAHERETLEAVIAARNHAQQVEGEVAAQPGDAGKMRQLLGAEAGLTGALGRLFAVAEAYPDLKANQNMMAVQAELTSTENKVAYARQAYNDSVTRYNTGREQFPVNVIAGTFGFEEAELFEVQVEAERQAPEVDF